MTKLVLPGSNQAGQPGGYAALDGAGGLLVPAYLEATQQGSAPAAPATGKTRLYVDSAGLLQMLPAAGAARRVVTHWGQGTAFPTGIGPGDTYLRTDLGAAGTLYSYQGGAVGLSGWIPESGPLAGGSGTLLARVERQSAAGPVVGNTMVAFDAGANTVGSPTFTLASQTRVQLQAHGKLNSNTNGGAVRVNLYLTPGSTGGIALANQAGLFDMVIVNSTLGQTFTYECDTVLAAGTYTMSMGLSAPLSAGQTTTLVYEASGGGREPYSSTVMKALAIGAS